MYNKISLHMPFILTSDKSRHVDSFSGVFEKFKSIYQLEDFPLFRFYNAPLISVEVYFFDFINPQNLCIGFFVI